MAPSGKAAIMPPMSTEPTYALTYDPADISALRARLRRRPEKTFDPEIGEIIIGDDVLGSVGARVRAAGGTASGVVLVMDHTPMLRNGESIKPQVVRWLRDVAGDDRTKVIQPHQPGEELHAEFAIAEAIAADLPAGAVVVSFGSGVITDLAKHGCYLSTASGRGKHTWFCVPTACTVTAYTSGTSILADDGVKTTRASRLPDTMIVDRTLLGDAPPELTGAGYGDLVARCVAYGDWLLGSAVGIDESFSIVPYDMLIESEELLLKHADLVGRRTPAGMAILTDALLLAGLAMTVVNQSTPISGWEHALSHYFDLRAEAAGRPVGLHGSQVGAAAVTSARAFEDLLAIQRFPDGPPPRWALPEADVHAAIRRHFGPLGSDDRVADGVWRNYQTKWRLRADDRAGTWARLRDPWNTGELPDRMRHFVRKPDLLADSLSKAGVPPRLADTVPGSDAALLADGVRYAHLYRPRFMVADVWDAMDGLTDPRLRRWLA